MSLATIATAVSHKGTPGAMDLTDTAVQPPSGKGKKRSQQVNRSFASKLRNGWTFHH